MTLSTTLDRRSVRATYVVGAGGLAAAGLVLSQTGLVFDWALITAVLLYLGPLGVAALVILVIPVSLLGVSPAPILEALAVVLAVGVAILNVSIVRRWSSRRTGQMGTNDRAASRGQWDEMLGAAVFVLAGCGFILLSLCAGFAALTAHGIDVRTPEVEAHHILLLAAVTWWAGLATTVGGFLLWIVLARRARPVLPWAIADLMLIVALIAVLILG